AGAVPPERRASPTWARGWRAWPPGWGLGGRRPPCPRPTGPWHAGAARPKGPPAADTATGPLGDAASRPAPQGGGPWRRPEPTRPQAPPPLDGPSAPARLLDGSGRPCSTAPVCAGRAPRQTGLFDAPHANGGTLRRLRCVPDR